MAHKTHKKHKKRDPKSGRYRKRAKTGKPREVTPAMNPKLGGLMPDVNVKDLKKLGTPAVAILIGNRGAAKASAWAVGQFLANAPPKTKVLAEAGLSFVLALLTIGAKKDPNFKLAALGMATAGIESVLGLFGPLPLLSGFRNSQVISEAAPRQLAAPATERLALPAPRTPNASATGPKSPVYANTDVTGFESAY